MVYKRKTDRPYTRRKPGDRFGTVVLVEYLGKDPINKNGYWSCLCDCGNLMRVQSGQVSLVRSCGKGIHNSQYTETPSYQRVHNRLSDLRGPAREAGQCADCDAPAQEWSYQGGCPEELRSPLGYPYSTNPDLYVPRCLRCHRTKDYYGGKV